MVLLSEICEFNYGESLPEHKRQSGDVPVYGSNGVVGWHNQSVSTGPTIVIGRKGSIGKIHLSEVPCYPIDTTYYIAFPLPPLPLQQKFATIVQRFERLRSQQQQADRQAEHLFQSILHRAFRGEL